jgi:hypothetical protein
VKTEVANFSRSIERYSRKHFQKVFRKPTFNAIFREWVESGEFDRFASDDKTIMGRHEFYRVQLVKNLSELHVQN